MGLQLVAKVPRIFLLGNKELRRNSELLIDLGVRASQGGRFFSGKNPKETPFLRVGAENRFIWDKILGSFSRLMGNRLNPHMQLCTAKVSKDKIAIRCNSETPLVEKRSSIWFERSSFLDQQEKSPQRFVVPNSLVPWIYPPQNSIRHVKVWFGIPVVTGSLGRDPTSTKARHAECLKWAAQELMYSHLTGERPGIQQVVKTIGWVYLAATCTYVYTVL